MRKTKLELCAAQARRAQRNRVKMQYKKLSLEIIRQELLKVQAEIIKDNATGEKYLLPSRISQETKQLYRIIGIKPPDQIQAILWCLRSHLRPNKINELSYFVLEVGRKM
jgi:hypothetical protein